MHNKILLKILVILLLAAFIFGCVQKAEESSAKEQPEEQFVETGILNVKSSPAGAQVYVDGELKGDSPLTLYNFPVGQHNVVVKKDSYSDFEKTVAVVVGRTEEVDALLTPAKKAVEKSAQEEKKVEEQTQEPAPPAASNKINLSKFAMYLDFDKMSFTELREAGSDVFIRRYDTYVDFVVMSPAKIGIISKPLNEIKKEDCYEVNSGVAQLFSGQTLCVISTEGNFFAASGKWEKAPTQLEWVMLN